MLQDFVGIIFTHIHTQTHILTSSESFNIYNYCSYLGFFLV